ncbi:MAG: hypothetical protein AB1753_01655 [Thermoproteota archaeon]
MVDEIHLGVLVAVVVIGIPMFIIASQFKAELSGMYGATGPLVAMPAENDLYVSGALAKSNPEEALSLMYNAQASDELERCSDPSYAELCQGSIELIVQSCIESQQDLAVCHDPRIAQYLPKA